MSVISKFINAIIAVVGGYCVLSTLSGIDFDAIPGEVKDIAHSLKASRVAEQVVDRVQDVAQDLDIEAGDTGEKVYAFFARAAHHNRVRTVRRMRTERDSTFHRTPRGCVDLESRTFTPLAASCR